MSFLFAHVTIQLNLEFRLKIRLKAQCRIQNKPILLAHAPKYHVFIMVHLVGEVKLIFLSKCSSMEEVVTTPA